MPEIEERCLRCRLLKSQHIVLTDANDDTLAVLICPSAVYLGPEPLPREEEPLLPLET